MKKLTADEDQIDEECCPAQAPKTEDADGPNPLQEMKVVVDAHETQADKQM